MILDEIVKYKRQEVAIRKKQIPITQNGPEPRGFLKKTGKVQLIAELKKASPSMGVIRQDFRPVELAKACVEAGASALSILTDERFFQGSLEYIRSVRGVVDVPILRKDFIIDEYQILEARAWGADAVLLLACVLSPNQMQKFLGLAHNLGLSAIVEVHSEDDLYMDMDTVEIIGINNRDLKTFKVDIKNTERLISRIPKDKFIISESGIFTKHDVEYLVDLGVDAVLVGEAIMRSPDVGAKVRELCG